MWWRAVYRDGSVLDEVAGLSSESIDRSRLRRFELRSGALDVLALEFPDSDKKLVFRRRTEFRNGLPVGVVCLVGWNGPDGLHLWRCTEDDVIPDPFPEVQLVPCEV
jgi:hypothetical protein